MPTLQPTRRTFLKRTSAALLAAGTVVTSGCTETLPPLGQRVQYGRVDTPRPNAEPVYRRWLPAASALPADDLDPGYVNFVMPGELEEAGSGILKEPHFFQKPYLDYFGLGYETYDRVLQLHRTTQPTFVLEGEIDQETVSQTLVESGYQTDGSYADYALFTRSDSSRTAAVRSDAIVWAHHPQSTAIVTAVIDAELGAATRHLETDPAFARLTEEIGASPWTMIGGLGVDPTNSALARSLSATLTTDGVYYSFHSLYPEGKTVSEHVLKDALEQNSRAVNGRSVDLQIQDRLATIDIQLPHRTLQTEYADATIPQITWGVTELENAIRLRHEVGESTPADTITFDVQDGDGRSLTEATFSDNYKQIQSGDSITIDTTETSGPTRIMGTFSPSGAARSCQFVVYERP